MVMSTQPFPQCHADLRFKNRDKEKTIVLEGSCEEVFAQFRQGGYSSPLDIQLARVWIDFQKQSECISFDTLSRKKEFSPLSQTIYDSYESIPTDPKRLEKALGAVETYSKDSNARRTYFPLWLRIIGFDNFQLTRHYVYPNSVEKPV